MTRVRVSDASGHAESPVARAARLICGLGFAVLALLAPHPAAAGPGDVKTTFDAPCRYPAGMASDGAHLYLLDWREAQVHQLSADDGVLIRTFPAPTLKPQGLAWGDGRLFVADDHSGQVCMLDPESGIVERSIEAPGKSAVGLAYLDGVLYLLERESRQIYKVLPEDGTILGQFASPSRGSANLTCDGRYLWASDRYSDELYRIDPQTGKVIGILKAPGPYPAGLAWLDGHLWNADFQNRKVYQLVINDAQKYSLSDTREARVELLWALYNYGPADVKDLTVAFAVPPTLPQQELLSEPEFSQPPARTVTDHWGQACALFERSTVAAGTRLPLSYSVKVRVSAIRWLITPEQTGTLADVPEDIRAAWTVDDPRYGTQSEFIQKTVREIVGDEQNPYWIARKIYDYIASRLEYEMVGGWDAPEVVLKRGSGSCSEYTFAMIAMCRAAGLPARYQGAVVVRGDDASIDEPHHRWAEVYLPNYGWVPVDAERGDKDSPAAQAHGFGELANHFLITTQGGGGSEYLAWGYNSHHTYKATGYCKVELEDLGFWEPLAPAQGQQSSADAAQAPAQECKPE